MIFLVLTNRIKDYSVGKLKTNKMGAYNANKLLALMGARIFIFEFDIFNNYFFFRNNNKI